MNERLEDEVNRERIRTGALVGGLALCLGTQMAFMAGGSIEENNLVGTIIYGVAGVVAYGLSGYLCYAAYSIWKECRKKQ